MTAVARTLYDKIGHGYAAAREPDPAVAGAIRRALADARSVVNVGAGTGAYEPADLNVLAVEPSAVMLAQRPPQAAPAVRAAAEALPLPDDSVDAAMAVLSDHHWGDRAAGLRELRRVARRRVVLFNADPAEAERFWLTTEYLPAFLDLIPPPYRRPGYWEAELVELLGPLRVEPVPIRHDCRDGFYGAYWRRPAAYLESRVRAGISVFARLPEHAVAQAVRALKADLASGSWQSRHAELLTLDDLDLGYRAVVAELA